MKSEIDGEKTGSTQSSQNDGVKTQKRQARMVVSIRNGERIEDVSKTMGMMIVNENEKKMRRLIINSALRGLVHIVHVVLSSL